MDSGEWIVARQTSRWQRASIFLLPLLFAAVVTGSASCVAPSVIVTTTPTSIPLAGQTEITISLIADGRNQQVATTATTVGELLAEAGVELGALDEVEPLPSAALEPNMVVTVVRVTESLEVVPESIPFERRIVRSDALEPDDPPRVVQSGRPGLQEVTVRLVFRDGLEAERWPTNVTVIEPAQDEIVMIGAGPSQESIPISGTLAFINDGRALLLRDSTAVPIQLPTGRGLDGRVFTLSPDGQFLLYTRTVSETNQFHNSLWLVETAEDAEPRPLEVENVLWAGWDPAAVEEPRIAYTTADPVSQPPGWEANNDLWLGVISPDDEQPFAPQQLIDSYPITFGWWGGNYAWSPDGRYLAYGYANEIGLIDTQVSGITHEPLFLFTEYNTRSDWVWVPALSWSPDGRYLTFSNHPGTNPDSTDFDLWIMDVERETAAALSPDAGMWSHAIWSPVGDADEHPLVVLLADDAADSQRSSYSLWSMDQDGSNAQQLYPPQGETSFFARDATSVAWSPDGRAIAFIFHDSLYILDLSAGITIRVTQDESRNSHPTWTGNQETERLGD